MTCKPLTPEEAAKLQAQVWPKRRAYVFMVKRPIDKEEWPVAYGGENAEQLAKDASGRHSPVITVDFDAERATPEERAELEASVKHFRGLFEAVNLPDAGLAPVCGALLDLVEGLLDGRVKL